MIPVIKSPTADSRSCDSSKVSKEELRRSSQMHMHDVWQAMLYFQQKLVQTSAAHDFDKIADLDRFHKNFQTDFAEKDWLEDHWKLNRHHLTEEKGIPDDVNLIDVLEYVGDCVVAGMARTGTVYDLELPDELLQRALKNTVEDLKSQVKLIDPPAEKDEESDDDSE